VQFIYYAAGVVTYSVGVTLDRVALSFDTYPRAHNLDITRQVF
jgi:hypothetical protein